MRAEADIVLGPMPRTSAWERWPVGMHFRASAYVADRSATISCASSGRRTGGACRHHNSSDLVLIGVCVEALDGWIDVCVRASRQLKKYPSWPTRRMARMQHAARICGCLEPCLECTNPKRKTWQVYVCELLHGPGGVDARFLAIGVERPSEDVNKSKRSRFAQGDCHRASSC